MRRLKAKKAKYRYKNEAAWLKAVYRNNKELIDSTLSILNEKSKFKSFKQLVKERKETRGESTYRAVQNIGKSEVFTSRKERLQENVFKAIKSDKEMMRQFRQKIGWKQKIDISKFEWDYNDNVYKYDNLRIDISNSPYGIKIYS